MFVYTSERILTVYDRNYRVSIIKVKFQKLLLVSLRAVEFFLKNLIFGWRFQAVIYTGNVLALYMSRPPGFKYKSGMYLFVKCPDISNFEW